MHTERLRLIRGGVPRSTDWPPSRRTRDLLRRHFDNEFRTAVIRMCSAMRRQPSPKFYEIRRSAERCDRPWGQLLKVIDEAIVAGAPIERVQVLADLLRAYVDARTAERPLSPLGGAVAVPEEQKRAA
jgi:hypothetical protein